MIMQGYGATETGNGTCNSWNDHPPGTVGRPMPGVEMRIADDGEVQFRGPTVTQGYWQDPEATARRLHGGRLLPDRRPGPPRRARRLVLHGRKQDMIVLPNSLNVFPEDIENALRVAGIRDSVVLETEPGRIEAIVLAPTTLERVQEGGTAGTGWRAPSRRSPTSPGSGPRWTPRCKAANATLAVHARVAAWRFWPDADFPRTHTLKVKRDQVRAWASVAAPLPVTEAP